LPKKPSKLDYTYIDAALPSELTRSSDMNIKLNNDEWFTSYGDYSSNRFSSLNQINKLNVSHLKPIWQFNSGLLSSQVQSSPVVVNKTLFTPIGFNDLVALDASNGSFKWRYTSKFGPIALRGLTYDPPLNSKNLSPRLYFVSGEMLTALNLNTRKPDWEIAIGHYANGPPVIVNETIYVVSAKPAIHAFNKNDGKLLWTIPLVDKLGKSYGAWPWSGAIALDIKRKIGFISMGNAKNTMEGINRPGDNAPANSLIAIDLEKKSVLWVFQEVHHDIWDLDIAASPVLTSIFVENAKVDVVAAVTKSGNTVLLDRLTGKPIFKYRLRRTKDSKINGEKVSPYQPDLELPEPFSKQSFSEDDITNIGFLNWLSVRIKLINKNFGFYEPHEVNKGSVWFGIHGGAEWPGPSIDPRTSVLYVASNHIPWSLKLLKNGNNYFQDGWDRLLDYQGYPGSKPPWGELIAINLNTGKKLCSAALGEYKELTKKGIPLTGTENFGGPLATQGGVVFVSGTIDGYIRAFDSENCRELWRYKLPFIGSAPPISFSIDGRQYIFIAATGGGKLSFYNAKVGDAFVAFALPKK
jgi:quinoprotein glucose dehydrogenase